MLDIGDGLLNLRQYNKINQANDGMFAEIGTTANISQREYGVFKTFA